MRTLQRGLLAGLVVALLPLVGARPASGQEVRIRDLTTAAQDVPVRVMGYGLVVGLDGTGDRAIGHYGSVHTVRSVTNLLRRFDIEVPPEVLRTRNVAAVLVTAEISPYLRAVRQRTGSSDDEGPAQVAQPGPADSGAASNASSLPDRVPAVLPEGILDP